MSQDILERLQAWLSHETLETDPAAVVREAAREIKRLRDQWEIRGHVMDSIADLFVKPRWIPVGERLPEEHGKAYLLACREGGSKSKSRIVSSGTYEGDGHWTPDFNHMLPSEVVTHWMPLPEPPSA